jgi:hypothetical protein
MFMASELVIPNFSRMLSTSSFKLGSVLALIIAVFGMTRLLFNLSDIVSHLGDKRHKEVFFLRPHLSSRDENNANI